MFLISGLSVASAFRPQTIARSFQKLYHCDYFQDGSSSYTSVFHIAVIEAAINSCNISQDLITLTEQFPEGAGTCRLPARSLGGAVAPALHACATVACRGEYLAFWFCLFSQSSSLNRRLKTLFFTLRVSIASFKGQLSIIVSIL